jgi:hypothetical protein
MSAHTTSDAVRGAIVEALQLDLIGPDNSHAFAKELLPDPPSRWYLTGFLVPVDAPEEQRTDATSADEIESGGDSEATDDAAPPDRGGARKSLLPSSMGLSVLVAPDVELLDAVVFWGDYIWESPEAAAEPVEEIVPATPEAAAVVPAAPPAESLPSADASSRVNRGYRRDPREEHVAIVLPAANEESMELAVPNSGGLTLTVICRTVADGGTARLAKGTRSVSVFLVNRRPPNLERRYRAFIFQATLALQSPKPFIPRPDLRGGSSNEWDERVADLQYRDVFEYAVGHGVSATTKGEPGTPCTCVSTCWIPSADVERVAPATIPDVELSIEALGALASSAEAAAKLTPLVTHYLAWIAAEKKGVAGLKLEPQREKTARDLFVHAEHAAKRIQDGIDALNDATTLEAFRIANRTMARAARQREAVQAETTPASVPAPRWRPFQLAFILMNLRGILDPTHADRETVDLLFFPTGGGKTEAYLGLAAFSMVLRRLRHPGIRSAGLSVLMRYTLRLLTLDQLGRAAGLVCALELEREADTEKLGEWPFEIGLWVGQAATPNRMGRRGDSSSAAEYSAYTKTTRFQRDDRSNPAPIPIENCPWCGTKFTRMSFRLVPNVDRPLNLAVHCVNHACEFSGDRPLPILGVDEPIYRRLPAFLIATVDKFAALPWTGEAGALFGLVDHYDKNGFYGPSADAHGTSLGGPLPPPELIIQDELHLISGPLGTIAGVYETTIDALASRVSGDMVLRPKIVASTATVRRADSQIRALFDRQRVEVFPPPGSDRRNSFFAQTEPTSKTPARRYVGIAAPGRSLKVILLRASLALLSAGKTIYEREGGKKNKQNPVDPYMTLLGYFNSLRELGGSRRIIEDEVRTRVAQYSRRRRRDPNDNLFSDRTISYDVLELTSRVATNQVATAKRRLALRFHEDERVDVALATNMISVGLDIIRLGLMVVLGQPKTSAEYIQATSRVGRDAARPGLVVTLLNVHKPRDRSHYERFETYHATFYRSVEATSVTPFSPRALDRALAASLVALCRQGRPEMTPALGANEVLVMRAQLEAFAERFAERALNHDGNLDAVRAKALRDNVLARCRSLLDDWVNIATEFQSKGTKLQYQEEVGGAKRLLYDFLHPDLPHINPIQRHFRANRSMRDVEPSVELTVKNLNDWGSSK